MLRLTRRTFVGWIGSLGAFMGFSPLLRGEGGAQASLSERDLLPLGEAIFPGELGHDGVQSAVRAFARWLAAYKPEVEVLHGYGTGELRSTPPSPSDRWRRQLVQLDTDAKQRHGRAFASLTRPERQALVRDTLGRERIERLPAPLAAPHVAVALLSHYFGSSDANDLCYGVRIGRNSCRPLINAPREPIALARRRTGT
jgi:hypothetical protein